MLSGIYHGFNKDSAVKNILSSHPRLGGSFEETIYKNDLKKADMIAEISHITKYIQTKYVDTSKDLKNS